MSENPSNGGRGSQSPAPLDAHRYPPSAHDTGAPSHHVRALECRVDGGGIAIPVDLVGQIVEYEVAPLPLARGSVRGLGLVDGRLVVSLGVGRAGGERRHTKGILLRTADLSGHWAFEVLEVLSFVMVEPPRGRGVARVVGADRRALAWIDIERVMASADALLADGAWR